ncbi:Aspartyl-tRNA(Asn) amidotransferase subunit C Glutamyl-tRNA(Gln) amidotransferase subunit C [Arcticibacter svalbardensis MN12-7]|uniref:Aspartyl/glutamyl-tRNA(Asn/Gln) amidotransferase subunit C n=1 Tax=Arcticibacter svalbardensis MN12-7 TaxID=1150600 RepID=R9GVB2_9SPHI|nr:Asp-tRNA(Asn)/Glu-tRNA(Gln) amidotransferase subunit GatC [Arcticibacter svalbardensis]EOR95641.1 Aspartyl-tRNA(Asn) amidotransferase subunit C Glutamyl-tRNA(Gln) amidotransferase subunit C [Arcticibacter svalbardensis MN12-7]
MKLDYQTIERMAHLARLEVSEVEKVSLLKDMENILSFMEKLNELDTSGVEPLIYLNDEVNVLRDDVEKNDICPAEALKNAPLHDDVYFKVAKVIERN